MDIVVKGRRTDVAESFRVHVHEKLAKVTRLDGKVIRIDVEIDEEHNPRIADQRSRVELTCRIRGPVIRAEACAPDPYAALDLATTRLEARLRKAAGRRRVHHGIRTPVSVATATARLAASNGVAAPSAEVAPVEVVEQPDRYTADGGPFLVREKEHFAAPMTLDDALFEMELVGHDFFLFVDAERLQPSVVYRRRGYDYGVIRIASPDTATD